MIHCQGITSRQTIVGKHDESLKVSAVARVQERWLLYRYVLLLARLSMHILVNDIGAQFAHALSAG